MQWHQQIICTSFRTGNHTNTSSLSFYRPDAQPTVSKHRKHLVSRVFIRVQDAVKLLAVEFVDVVRICSRFMNKHWTW